MGTLGCVKYFFPHIIAVHELRPGDIDVVAAYGDSISVGVSSSHIYIYDLFIDSLIHNHKIAWVITGNVRLCRAAGFDVTLREPIDVRFPVAMRRL